MDNDKKDVRVTCPHCGSEDLAESEMVPRHNDVTSWRIDEKGNHVPDGWAGEDEAFWELSEPAGDDWPFHCNGCREDVPHAELRVEVEEEVPAYA